MRLNTCFPANLHNIRFTACLLLVCTLVLSLFIIPGFADTTSVDTSKTVSNPCGNRVTNYSYRVPFGDSPWNIPACDLQPYNNDMAQAKDYASRLYNYGSAWDASTPQAQANIENMKGNFEPNFGMDGDSLDYTTPIYYTNASTKTTKVMLCESSGCSPSNLDDPNCWDVTNIICMAPDTAIPWDPSWRPAGSTDENYHDDASDLEMVIVDTATGYTYEIWGLDRDKSSCFGFRNAMYSLAGKDPDSRLCVSAVQVLRDSNGNKANYYTYNQGVINGRGHGIQMSAMLPTPEEVQAGEIRHALMMGSYNTMTGPACSPEQLLANNPNVVGKSCGFAVAPAAQFEWASKNSFGYLPGGTQECPVTSTIADYNTKQTFGQLLTMDKLLPEGMRFRLTLTDQQIDTWLDYRAKTDPNYLEGQKVRETARIFAIALKDYGWIIGDTTCYGSGFPTAGAANTDARIKWNSLGITAKTGNDLLKGLFSEDNIIAVEAPTNTCNDVSKTKTQFSCKWTSSKYSSVTTPSRTETTITTIPKVPTTNPVSGSTTTLKPVTTTSTSTTTTTTTTTPTTTMTSRPTTTTTPRLPVIKRVLDKTAPAGPTTFSRFELLYNGWQLQPCSWITDCQLIINWKPATDASGISGYEFQRTLGSKTETFKLSAKTQSFIDKTINPGYEYTYRITSIDKFGNRSKTYARTTYVGCISIFCGTT